MVALHGSGEDETVYFYRYSIEEQAESRGWIVVAPYGRGQRSYEHSGAADVWDVIKQVRRQWAIDSSRIYVTGHSMGGGGGIKLAMSNPSFFAAAAPVAGWADPNDIEKLKNIPVLWVVGDKDKEWATNTVRDMSAAAKGIGADHQALVLEGYDHGGYLGVPWPTVVETSLPGVFDFFAKHHRAP